MTIRAGPYMDLPPDRPYKNLRNRTRSLTGLLHDLGKVAKDEIVVVIPFLDPSMLNEWLSAWTEANPNIRVTMVHRQVPASRTAADVLRKTLSYWSGQTDARVSFFTYPRRRGDTDYRLMDAPTFHCKLIDPGTGHIVFLSSNLTEHAKMRNIEAGYVFGPGTGGDFRLLLSQIRSGAEPDPLAQPR